MSELKITIDQLKNYLGTGLTFVPNEFPNSELPLESLNCDAVMGSDEDGNEGEFYYDDIKLKCYRLSDLDKFIPELGFVPVDRLNESFSRRGEFDWYHLQKDSTDYPFKIIQKLFQWHFWPFGNEYFEAGLVIDKLLHNPSTN